MNVYGGSAAIENCSFFKTPLNFSYTDIIVANNEFRSCGRIQPLYSSSFMMGNIFDNTSIRGFGEKLIFIENEINNSELSILCDYRISHVIDNIVSNCEFGIILSGLVYVMNNELINVERGGIIVSDGACIIKNNTLKDSGGISVLSHETNGHFSSFDAIIEKNFLRNCSGYGLEIGKVFAYYGNNTMIKQEYRSVISVGSSLILFNNTLSSENPVGITSWDCSFYIINTTIDKNYIAITAENSSFIIVDSRISNDPRGTFEIYGETMEKCHFLLEDNSTISIKNTVFDEDEVIFEDYKSRLILPHKTLRKEKPPPGWRFYANIALVVVTVAVISLLILWYRRGKRKEGRGNKKENCRSRH